ncbi:MAG: type II secretion system protein [Planctomycetes bacterium]|nr:type II secretion system protein [Planctomycetota bacterium]
MTRRKRSGFTLAELLLVVAILATIGTIAFTMFGNTEKDAEQRVSIANQAATMKALQHFDMLNKASLDNFDSLLDYTTSDGTAGTFLTDAETLYDMTSPGVYRGLKGYNAIGDDALTDDQKKQNYGLHPTGLGIGSTSTSPTVGIYYLNSYDVTALKELGVTTVYDHNPLLIHANRGPYASAGVTSGPGFRVEDTPVFPRELAAGQPVLTVNPETSGGQTLYDYFNISLNTETETDDNGTPDDTSDDIETSTTTPSGERLLLFGLGNNCSIIGARKGGMNQPPQDDAVGKNYYHHYIVAVRLHSSTGIVYAEVAGVLSPKLETIRQARHQNDWRGGD